MELRRHNVQWYHETQGSGRSTAPLIPKLASVGDSFLLGFGHFADHTLQQAIDARSPVFNASQNSYHALFPERLTLSRFVTLSLYDRLSTALTVAQVTGVQSLCSHYAARLAPLDGPEASRESNIRLTQITQYARQLASQPTLICSKALQQLADVGLSPADIIAFSQVIGFVSYQARVNAGISALAGRPSVVLPGFPTQTDADNIVFNEQELSWQPRLADTHVILHERNAVFTHINAEGYGLSPRLKALVRLAVSRINGSRYCAAVAANQVQNSELSRALFDSIAAGLTISQQPVAQAVIRTASELTRAPEKFSPQSVQPLFNLGLNPAQILDVVLTTALYAWENRLRSSLGDVD